MFITLFASFGQGRGVVGMTYKETRTSDAQPPPAALEAGYLQRRTDNTPYFSLSHHIVAIMTP